MIKAIILDVDGVIVGEKMGYNSPYPHPDVISRLTSIRQKGIPISLCTAKPHYSIQKIIDDARLNNLHITNGGGVIIDPINNIILRKHAIDNKVAQNIVRRFLENDVYTELYSVEEYFVQENQKSDLTKTHTFILQRDPHIVSSLVEEANNQDIVKVMPIATDEKDKNKIIELFKPYETKLTLSWGIHPVALPHQFGIITTKGISKKQAVSEIAQSENISQQDILAVGDSISDWQFIKPCGYGATMENGNEELKQLILSKGEGKSFIGKSVDENGILGIFDYFSL